MAMTVRSQAVTRVLLIDIRHPRVVRAARKAGLQVHYLGARESAPDWLASGADSVSLIDDPSPEAMLAAARSIHAEQPFDVAVAMMDTYVEAAAEINEMLGLHANGLAVTRTVNDKARMRDILRDSTVGTVIATRVTTADEVKGFAAEAGYPFVVKPVDGTGSRGVTLVLGEADLDEAVARTVGSADETTGWVAEEYLNGPEFSVESFSADGVHHPLAVTEKFKGPDFVEIGHVVPARLPSETVRAVIAEVTACLDAVGLLEGPAHTEVVLTGRGARIVETHCRPAGDGIVELVRLAAGLDLHQIIFDWLAGRPLKLDAATGSRAAATWFLTPGPGTVSSVSGLAEARAAEGVTEAYLTVAPGETIGELRSSFDRSGAVIAAGDTPEQALQRAREAVGLIEVTVEG
jgi:biotin carboxylase